MLIVGGGLVLLALGYLLYQQFSSSDGAGTSVATPAKQTVPKDFGQSLFRDPRFYTLQPKVGTSLIQQTTAAVPDSNVAAPQQFRAFDVRSGHSVLLVWTVPSNATAVTDISIDRSANGAEPENIATLPLKTTTFLDVTAKDKTAQSYTAAFVRFNDQLTSPQVAARAGRKEEQTTETQLSVGVEPTDAGIRITWVRPQLATGKPAFIYRSTTAGALGQRVGSVGSDAQNFLDPQGKADLHFYTVRWFSSVTTGQVATATATASDVMPPESPASLVVVYDQDAKKFTISWSPSASLDVARYDVYRSIVPLQLGVKVSGESGVVPDPTLPVEKQNLQFVDANAPTSGTVYYSVLAVDTTGNVSRYQELQRSGRRNPFGEL